MAVCTRVYIALLSLFLVGILALPSISALPGQMSYQGRLATTSSGSGPVPDGDYTMRFYLLDAATGGNQLWNGSSGEEQSVTVTGGIYNVQLGAVEPMDSTVFAGGSVWLEVAIYNGNTTTWETLSPRQQITSTAYAFKAGDADMLEGETLADLESRYVNIGESSVVTSAMIADSTITASDLATSSVGTLEISTGAVMTADLADNSVTTNKIYKDAVGSQQIDDGTVTAADLADDYVNVSGDAMTGDLSIGGKLDANSSGISTGDYTGVFTNSGGNYAYAIKGVASSTTYSARGLFLDVDAPSSSAYGAYIDVDTSSYAVGLYSSANSDNSYANGINTNAVVDSGTGTARGLYGRAYNYGTGILYGTFTEGFHEGTAGDAYGAYSFARGSDTGESTGVYAKGYKSSFDTGGDAYGGHFVGQNLRDGGDSYGILAEASSTNGSNSRNVGVFSRANISATTLSNYGFYTEAANSTGQVWGLYADVDATTSESSTAFGAQLKVRADTASNSYIYGLHVHANHQGTSGGTYGIRAYAYPSDTGDAYGIYSSASSSYTSGDAYAGYFSGNVHVLGILSKSGGTFKIDHPQDPENKYLQHSFVESPDMKNVYDGNVILNEQGEAWVELPDYFEALNRDFRYQLTCIGGFAQVYIAEKVSGNRFKVAGGQPNMEISWQVTGIRQDAWAEANPVEVVVDKDSTEKGFYLNPEAFGHDETRGIEYAKDPEMVKERLAQEKEQILKKDRP